MARIRPERAYAKAAFDRFPCLMEDALRDGTRAASEMVNFRPRPDGSIEKRCGYERVFEAPSAPRAIYAGYFGGEEVLYFLAGRTVFCASEDDEYGYLYAGTVRSESGDAAFAEFMGALYLFDGEDVYVLSGSVFVSVEGYIPLYAKGWDPLVGGEIHEPENLLTPRVRLHYKNPNGKDTLYFGRRVLSLHRVWLDGVEIAKTDVELLSTEYGCTSEQFLAAKEIELLVTFDAEDERASVATAHRAAVYGGADDTRLFLYRGADPNAFLVSRPVTPRDAALSDAVGGLSGGTLYFPVDLFRYRLDAPITAVCRHGEGLLLFTASGASLARSYGDGALSVTPIHASVGCDAEDAAVPCGDFVATWFGGRIRKWTERDGTYDSEVLSAPVETLCASIAGRGILMQYYEKTGELWVMRRGDAEGRVLVYSPALGSFYTFSGVAADRLVPASGDPITLNGTELFRFDESLYTDADERKIRARYVSGYLDLGHPERTKHLVRFFLEGDPDGGKLTVRFHGDAERIYAVDLEGDAAERGVSVYDRRASVGRFRRVRFSFEAGGTARQSVSRFTVTARK